MLRASVERIGPEEPFMDAPAAATSAWPDRAPSGSSSGITWSRSERQQEPPPNSPEPVRAAPLAVGDNAAGWRGRRSDAASRRRAARPRLHQPGAARPVRRHPHALAGFQYVLPGEVALAPTALSGGDPVLDRRRGAFTTVDGDKCVMGRGTRADAAVDLARPGNDSTGPALARRPRPPDGRRAEAQFYEPSEEVADREAGRGLRAPAGIGQLRPTWRRPRPTRRSSTISGIDGGRPRRLASVGRRPAPSTTWRWSTSIPAGGPLMPTIAC
jgi:hypothetical protein